MVLRVPHIAPRLQGEEKNGTWALFHTRSQMVGGTIHRGKTILCCVVLAIRIIKLGTWNEGAKRSDHYSCAHETLKCKVLDQEGSRLS